MIGALSYYAVKQPGLDVVNANRCYELMVCPFERYYATDRWHEHIHRIRFVVEFLQHLLVGTRC